MKKNNITFLQLELARVSSWIEFADKKAGFLGIFYSAISGFVVTQHNRILFGLVYYSGFCLTLYVLILLILIIILIRGFYFLFYAVLPSLTNLSSNNSLFYYGSIAKKNIMDYINEVGNLTDQETTQEILEQIHTNSVIATKKMVCVRKSTHALFLVFFVLALLILFL